VENRKCRNSQESPKKSKAIQFSYKHRLIVDSAGWSGIKCCGRLFQIAGAEWRKARSVEMKQASAACVGYIIGSKFVVRFHNADVFIVPIATAMVMLLYVAINNSNEYFQCYQVKRPVKEP